MHAVARPPPRGRSGNSPLAQSARARTRSADGSGSPAAARRGRAASPGWSRASRARRRRRAPTAGGSACTGVAAPRRPSSIGPVSTTWPAYITATRSHVWATTARSCETKTTLTPSLALQRCEQAAGSGPGSSRRARSSARRRGAASGSRRARSRSSRAAACRPRARADTPRQRRSGSGMPTRRISSSARSRACRRLWPRRTRGPSAIWSPTRMTGFRAVIGSWKTIAISRPRSSPRAIRRARARSVAVEDDLAPGDRARGRGSRPTSARSAIVLPEPDSPTRPSASPRRRLEATRRRLRGATPRGKRELDAEVADVEDRCRSFRAQEVGEAVARAARARAR